MAVKLAFLRIINRRTVLQVSETYQNRIICDFQNKLRLFSMPPKRKADSLKDEEQSDRRGKRKAATKNEEDENKPSTKDKKKPTAKNEQQEKPNLRKRQAKVVKEDSDTEEEPTEESKPKTSNKGDAKPLNKTNSSFETINFKCTKSNTQGESHNFVIANWNVDGLRAWIKKGGLTYFEYEKPDVICLQETKCNKAKLPPEILKVEGYKKYWHDSVKDGYAGVALLSQKEPISVEYGIGDEAHDDEGRCVTAEYDKFYVISVYVPNAGRHLVTLPKRLEWNKAFKNYVKNLDKKKPVIVCGDMNVAHTEIDLANPKTNTKNAGFTKEEREGMTDFLGDGYVDTFRKLYPDQTGAYTFWTYMRNARSKNVGWRLDYFIVSGRLMENVCDNVIRNEVFGSDHCPIALFFNI